MVPLGVETLDLEGSGADARAGDVITGAFGNHSQPVIHQLQRHVGEWRVQGDLHGHVVKCLDVGDHLDRRTCRAIAVRVQHTVQRIDHVGGIKTGAVVECHAISQIEGPDGGILIGVPVNCQIGLGLAVESWTHRAGS